MTKLEQGLTSLMAGLFARSEKKFVDAITNGNTLEILLMGSRAAQLVGLFASAIFFSLFAVAFIKVSFSKSPLAELIIMLIALLLLVMIYPMVMMAFVMARILLFVKHYKEKEHAGAVNAT